MVKINDRYPLKKSKRRKAKQPYVYYVWFKFDGELKRLQVTIISTCKSKARKAMRSELKFRYGKSQFSISESYEDVPGMDSTPLKEAIRLGMIDPVKIAYVPEHHPSFLYVAN